MAAELALGSGPALKGVEEEVVDYGPDANDAVAPVARSACAVGCIVVAFWRKGDSWEGRGRPVS